MKLIILEKMDKKETRIMNCPKNFLFHRRYHFLTLREKKAEKNYRF